MLRSPVAVDTAPDPKNSKLVEMTYDVKHGTEYGLRNFLFPSLHETYHDLLEAATQPKRADLLLLGELNYAGRWWRRSGAHSRRR